MTLQSYFSLCLALLKDYFVARKTEDFSVEMKGGDQNEHIVIKEKNSGKVRLSVFISNVGDTTSLINFFYHDPVKVENLVIDWKSPGFHITLPLDTIPTDTKEQFAYKLDRKLEENTGLFKEVKSGEQAPTKKDSSLREGPLQLPGLESVGAKNSEKRIPDMPGFEDDYEMLSRSSGFAPTGNFPVVGDRDLNPPGLPNHPSLKPFIDPLGMYNPGEGGMFMLSRHPFFKEGPPPDPHGPASRRGVPPGARFDDPMADNDPFSPSSSASSDHFGSRFSNFGSGPGSFNF